MLGVTQNYCRLILRLSRIDSFCPALQSDACFDHTLAPREFLPLTALTRVCH
jgi:hypothetical protein